MLMPLQTLLANIFSIVTVFTAGSLRIGESFRWEGPTGGHFSQSPAQSRADYKVALGRSGALPSC